GARDPCGSVAKPRTSPARACRVRGHSKLLSQLHLPEGDGRRCPAAANPHHRRLDRRLQLGRNPRHVRRDSHRCDATHPLRPHLSAPLREAGLKTAILSHIHANWQALEAVLRDCPPVDETICLGDVVGYGGSPKRCGDEGTKRGWLTLVGNHDRACTDPEILEWFNDDAAAVVRWTIEVIGEERLQW